MHKMTYPLRLINSMQKSYAWGVDSFLSRQRNSSHCIRLITVFTGARHLVPILTDKSGTFLLILLLLRSTLILFYYLRLCLVNGLFPSGFRANTLYAFLFSQIRVISLLISLLLLLLSSLLSPLCRVFTITYLKQTMFLGYIVLQLFSIYNLCYM